MIQGRIFVTMQNIKTFRAFEDPFTEGHIFNIFPTTAASMTASSGLGVFNELSATHYGFVGQHIHKHSPRSIIYTFSKIRIMNHIFDVEGFPSNYSISQCKASAQLVKPVSTYVADFEMLLCQSEPCLSSISRT